MALRKISKAELKLLRGTGSEHVDLPPQAFSGQGHGNKNGWDNPNNPHFRRSSRGRSNDDYGD